MAKTEKQINNIFWSILIAFALLSVNGCENISTKTESSSVSKQKSLKPSKSKSAKLPDLTVDAVGFPGNTIWKLHDGNETWVGSLVTFSPSVKTHYTIKNKTRKTLNEGGRKTIRVVSEPIEIGLDKFICTQEASTLNDFPGILFRIGMKNIGRNVAPAADIQFFFSMKGENFHSWNGKGALGRPWDRIKGLKNWVFMPNPKGTGLALITNFAKPGVLFCSSLRRSDKNGKIIDKVEDSKWGLRNLGQSVKPGQKNELVFALVPVNSSEEAVQWVGKLESAKLFPELKLAKGDCSIQKPKLAKAENDKKIEVAPLLDPKYYSVLDVDANKVEKWLKKEIRPENYDIWHNKKNRIYLDGIWKLMKLAGTRYMSECDYGLKHDYEKADFNDSKWFNQPVPFSWNMPFERRDGERSLRPNINFGGVGWYRRQFSIPKKDQGKRIILCCPGINEESTVYINGKKVAYHKSISIERAFMYLHQQRHEYFEVDITPYLRFGEKNTIAIRVFDDGDFNHHMALSDPKYAHEKYSSFISGIWQEVYLDIRPDVYLKKAMVDYKVKDSTAKIKAYVVNTKKESEKEKLRLDFAPWKSKRYSLAKGKSFSHELGEQTLKPGLNKLTFNIKLDNPQLWSPESPFLYEMKLANAKGESLGEERVGFNEFTAGKDSFYLNGKRITLRSQQSLWMRLMRMLNNRRNLIEKWFDKYKGLNHNITRCHGTFYPHSFYDIADEKGVMNYIGQPFGPPSPLFDKNGQMTDFFREKTKETAEEAERHPSIVAFSMGNELYDAKLLGKEKDEFKLYLDQFYDEFKKHNQSTLVCASGRSPTAKSLKKTGGKGLAFIKTHAKTDFYSMHNYHMSFMNPEFAEDDDWAMGFKKQMDAYHLDDGPKVLWNCESGISSIARTDMQLAKEWDKTFSENMKNGLLDRKWFAEKWSFIPRSNQAYDNFNRRWAIAKFGLLGMLKDTAMVSQGDFMKRLTELHRRKRQYVAGIIANCPMIMERRLRPNADNFTLIEPVATMVKKANQPVLACLDGKWNRNIFSGSNPVTPLHLINDRENAITDATIGVYLRPLDYKGADIALKTVKTGKMTPAEIKEFDYAFEVPESIQSGHYSVRLKTSYNYQGQKLSSENDYKTYVLNRKDVKLGKVNDAKVALLQSDGDGMKQTIDLLRKLEIPFTLVNTSSELKNFKILILPAYCLKYPDGIAEWIQNGGKLLCLEQKELPKLIPQKVVTNSLAGYFSELILPVHPVFNGLNQSDFKYWNGDRDKIKNKWVCLFALIPLNEGVLASQMTTSCRVGMNAAEYHLGKGTCLFSQMDAVKRFGSDSVATKYLLNILNYCLGDWAAPDAPTLDDSHQLAGPAFQIDPKTTFQVDIRPVCTMGFVDEKAGDGKGGWTDQGPKNDLRELPVGKQTFNGVPFEIIDPKSNNGKSCIVLRGKLQSGTGFLPKKCRIILNRKAERLYFLVSAAWVGRDGKPIAEITVTEKADGTEMCSIFQFGLLPGKNINDWWEVTAKPPEAELGWTGYSDDGSRHVGTFIVEWVNPNPNTLIQHIDFESAETSVPAILAITGIK